MIIIVGTMVRVIGTTDPEMTCQEVNGDGTYLCGWWIEQDYHSDTFAHENLELV